MEDRSKKYDKLRMIGAGMFGKAWLVRSRQSRRSYVIKEIDVSGMTSEEMAQAVNEVAILSRLKHKNVIRYREAFSSSVALHIVMEFADQGDLAQQIEQQRRDVGHGFTEDRALDWTVQICFALSYIHDNKILHRDLKPANIFLTSSRILKVGDFGIAKILKNTLDHAQTAIGTPYYLSPEICQRKPYNQKSDIWAVGCVLYQLVTLKHPFQAKDFSNLVMNILSGIYPSVPSNYSLLVSDLVSVLLRVSPERRPTALQILGVPKLRAYVTNYTNRKNESCTSGSESTVNSTVEEERKVRARLGGVSCVTDADEAESKRGQTNNFKRKRSSVVISNIEPIGCNGVNKHYHRKVGNVDMTKNCLQVGKTVTARRESEVLCEAQDSSQSGKSSKENAPSVNNDDCSTGLPGTESGSVETRADTKETNEHKEVRRTTTEKRQRCSSTSSIRGDRLGGRIKCQKTYILDKGRRVPRRRKESDNGVNAERKITDKCDSFNQRQNDKMVICNNRESVANVKMQHKQTRNPHKRAKNDGRRPRVATSRSESTISSSKVYSTTTSDNTIEIAEVMHAGTPTADDDTGSVRGRLESLREFLEDKLGTVKCVDAFDCLEETTESRRLVELMRNRIGSNNMRYFPVLLQVWNLENRCH